LFECRVGIKLRLVFDAEPGVLLFSDLGTHDEIRKILKNR
jgi:mRNA-degrading endonuclease YafQ of YafQ-DinJ toxin-antitoxin module